MNMCNAQTVESQFTYWTHIVSFTAFVLICRICHHTWWSCEKSRRITATFCELFKNGVLVQSCCMWMVLILCSKFHKWYALALTVPNFNHIHLPCYMPWWLFWDGKIPCVIVAGCHLHFVSIAEMYVLLFIFSFRNLMITIFIKSSRKMHIPPKRCFVFTILSS